jgi:hypothetical protein
MDFAIKINCDNAAFGDEPELEIIRILDRIKQKLTDGHTYGGIMDINGNSVGSFDTTE